ncbi:arylsulfatase [Methylocystis heyeri]|uniref:Sulfatase-like hydrolase/transferase n=1 Tax=Methylocystis heyeri TaxID=391905 RepID=A0A6B8KHE3_9HYPH|nr:arylsulfatase [Methylocystis heyeri]QGM47794.1 sulfatase-like hydrolase/transferase [Methylocystis heyeri]
MRNRALMRNAGLALSSALVFLGASADAAPRPQRPNILLILADDMGYSDVGAYGGEIYTPSIDRLAAQGIRFTNFHTSAYCAPTRSMLMTGADNHRVGLGNMSELLSDNQIGKPGYEGALNGRAPTVATTLRKAGYHTYMAGKWHLGKTRETLPASQGFEESVVLAEGGADNFEKKSYTPGYATVHFYEGVNEIELPDDFYSTKFYTDKLLSYIDKNSDDKKPFFGYLSFQAVHQPHQAPENFIHRYDHEYDSGWSAIRDMRYQRQTELGIMPGGLSVSAAGGPDWAALSPEQKKVSSKRMAVYAGMVEYMDMSIGRVVAHLKEKGLLDNTVVLFLSDNGGESAELQKFFPAYYEKNFDLSYDHIGQKGSYSEYGPGWAGAANTPFPNYKGSASEGGIRAPLIIRYPKRIGIDQTTDKLASVVDVVPTILDYAGVRSARGEQANLAGVTMAPLAAGKSTKLHDDGIVAQEVAGGSAVFQGDYKLVRNAPPFGDFKWRLYNIKLDPTESKDVSADNPKVFEALQSAYADYVRRNDIVEVPPDYTIDGALKKNMARKK